MAVKAQTNDLKSYTIPNLVQGVSQQVPEQRRDTQAEDQYDCINSPVNGCEARPPVEVLGFVYGADFSNAFCRQIARGDTEHYLTVISEAATGDRLRVFDLLTGEECPVTFTVTDDYLETDDTPREVVRGATLNDYSFLVNREVKPAIDPDILAANDYNEGIFFFKAGGYSITYQATVRYNGNNYTFRYSTPDNSASANAAYIGTNQLAATFYRAFTGGAAGPITSGTASPAAVDRDDPQGGVGAGGAGDTTYTGAITLVSLGFYVAINGNCLLVGRADDAEFTIDASDGVGDTHFKAVKDTAQAFSELPKSCFSGFTTMVIGSNKETDDDYYVTYISESGGQSGHWEECAMPGATVAFDPDTMPHVLVNTGYQQFEFEQPTWGRRVSGDGVENSLDPSFVGKRVEDIAYSNTRLLLLTEGTSVWSKNRNPYVFFPSTAQSTLDTDPIDVEVGGGTDIALLRKVVQSAETTFLWAEGIQFKTTSKQEPFKQGAVEAPPSTKYEFAAQSDPLALGQSLYFVSEPGDYSTIRDLLIQNGEPRGETDITEHVPNYIPQGIRSLTASDTRRTMFVHSEAEPNVIYTYNYLLSATERLQSAWNKWRLPEHCQVVWMGVRRNYLKMLLQIEGFGAIIAQVDLTNNAVDPGQTDRQTRLDLRIPEGLVQRQYDATLDETIILLPYHVASARGYAYVDENSPATCPMFVTTRTASDNSVRGAVWRIKSIAWSSTYGTDVIVVAKDCTAEELYIGFRISAERTESQFFYRSTQGAVTIERLQVVNAVYTYARSGYFRVEVTERLANAERGPKVYEMTGRTFGDPSNILGSYPIRGGTFKVPVNMKSEDCTVRAINDSFLPSRWTRLSVEHRLSFTATPNATPASRGQA